MLSREVRSGVFVSKNAQEVARAAARKFVDCAWQFIAREGRFCVALSGGKTPQELFRQLADKEYRTQVDWAKVHLFWSDERAVPPDSTESNFGLARRELLLHISIPPENIHRMEADRANIGRAAQDYEELLRRELELDNHGFPRFHLIFLGLGPDGHTASLFPGARNIRKTSRWVSTPENPQLKSRRMSLTLPVLNAAHHVIFLVAGADKAEILREVLLGKYEPPLPAQMVSVPEGLCEFLVDEAAARLLAAALAARGTSPAPAAGGHPASAKHGARYPR